PGTTPPVPGKPTSGRLGRPREKLPVSHSLWLLLPSLLFALVTWQVVAEGPLRALDERLSRAVVASGPRALTELLADLGSLPVALPVLAAAVGYALWRDRAGTRRYEVGWAVLAMAAVPALVVPLKALVDRPGPLTAETGYYPSGHTATAMVAYGAAALLITPYLRRAWATPAAGALTLATGVGLVLRGYHWPLDVVGSVCLSMVLLWPLGVGLLIRPGNRPRGDGPSGTRHLTPDA
ncbi:phosphatase PAP2 family protein, partial [Streptomyces sp. NPDC057638]|uniref:phosphatase PAP2 family protein n=1 Tax=Streptomyces sp. NPDC057638 TaxID=3346190 RepID=UPI00369CA02D